MSKNIKKKPTSKTSKIVEKNVNPFILKFRSIWAGTKRRFNSRKTKLKTYIKSENFQVPKKSIFKILMDGFMLSLPLSYYLPISIKGVVVLGCSWYFLTDKILPQIKLIISSFSLIRISK